MTTSCTGRAEAMLVRINVGLIKMSKIEEAWPQGWTGSGIIDCGQTGRMPLSVVADDDAFEIAKQNMQQILDRWADLWPEILMIVEQMLSEYEHPLKVASPQATIQIILPSKPISEDEEWSVSVLFPGHDGEWTVAINGWSPDPDESQPYF